MKSFKTDFAIISITETSANNRFQSYIVFSHFIQLDVFYILCFSFKFDE